MRRETAAKLIDRFAAILGSKDGLRCARALGCVNVVGEHTDSSSGFLLSMAGARAGSPAPRLAPDEAQWRAPPRLDRRACPAARNRH